MRRRSTILALALGMSAVAAIAPVPAPAHGFHEFRELAPALRDLALRVLERARAEGRLLPPPDAPVPETAAAGLDMVLDNISGDDFDWLGTVDLPALTTPRLGRVPAATVLELLYGLGDFARNHRSGEGNLTADERQDLDRLQSLENAWFGD